MVSLVKLSAHNFDTFKELSNKNLNEYSYDKNFFDTYHRLGFIPKVFLKKSVKLFLYNGVFVGYIWYEAPIDASVRIHSFYIDPQYTNLVNKNTLRTFDDSHLVYESLDTIERVQQLKNLGFIKVSSSLLMSLDVNSYNKDISIQNIYEDIYKLSPKEDLFLQDVYEPFAGPYITFDKVKSKSDILTRCHIQNEIFYDSSRVPIQIEDIENDINQDYYISDLTYFIKLNGLPIGYGQVIYTRGLYTIVNFGIIGNYRGLGFGKLLLNYLIKKSKLMDIETLYLRVDEKNSSAINLYNWIGFTITDNVNKWERR